MSDTGRLLSSLAGRVARRPALALALLGALGVAGAVVALGLSATASTDTLVGRSSAAYEATQSFYRSFGEEPVQVLVRGDLRKLLFSSDLERLVGLEGCLSGNVPSSAYATEGGAQGPCAQLKDAHSVKAVLGPGTFISEAALQIDRLLAARRIQAEREAARARSSVYRAAIARGLGRAQAGSLASQAARATMVGFAAEVSALAISYGLTAPPSLEDHEFISTLVFDSTKPAGTPKQRFASLFPGRDAALISVRLRAGLGQVRRSRSLALIRQAVAMPQWRLQNGESFELTGEPLIAQELQSSISHAVALLLIAALVAMALILGLVFTGRPRLQPLAIALLACALAFGALSLVGASLTMASVAVLPVLVGLAVDYAVQFQSGTHPPAIATALLATVAGLLVLLLSPVPMVRGFALLLVVGLVLAFACALIVCAAVPALAGRTPTLAGRTLMPPGRTPTLAGRAPNLAAPEPLAAAWQGAREILTDNPLTRLVSRTGLERAVAHPGRALAIGLALAALGWGLDTQTQVQTDIAKLAPQQMPALRSLDTLERASGVGGELDLMVSSRSSLATPATIAWMSSYQSDVLHRFGYSPEGGCGHAQLCPAFSLPDLFASGVGGASHLTRAQVNGLLSAIPAYFAQDVISPDRRTASLSLGIRLMSLQAQQRLIEQMRAQLHPPAGVRAQLVGLSVLAAQAGAQIASPWRRIEMLLAALGAVALLLLTLFRGDPRRALVPLVPIALATGWSALVLFAIRVPLNPMSVTLGALVIAVSTEFSVLLSERHRQEVKAGHGSLEALRRAYRRTGAAVAASGATAIAGFGVLALSDIAMLRDFGLATLVDLSVSLVGVWVALPAAVTLAERRERRWAARATSATSPSLG
jgi:uncharacterized protein